VPGEIRTPDLRFRSLRRECRGASWSPRFGAKAIAHTARPILAAAAVMAPVFGCLLVADVLEAKQFGFADGQAVPACFQTPVSWSPQLDHGL
jgi:hypothetical protein